ncbi:protein TESPA1 [Pelodytes ibericus]
MERLLTWRQHSRRQQITTDADDSLAAIMSIPVFTYEDLDNAFLEEGASIDMIQDWLHDCRSSMESTSEDRSQCHIKGPFSKGNSLEDDFHLGAEAISLFDQYKSSTRMVETQSLLRNMHLGNSMASNSTIKTCSSVSEILALYEEDAENVLYSLGFVREEKSKIPARFFYFPSKAEGIDFAVFIQSQMHKLEALDHR